MRRIAMPLLSVPLALAVAAHAESPQASAVAQLARQFDQHPIIQIGEFHRSGEIHAFLQQLLHTPAFICRADAVVVEFGNSRLQGLADVYAAGGDVDEAQLQSLWRETAVPLTWNSPLYRAVYESVHEINTRHRCAHPVRLVLADVPLDWSKIETVADYAPHTDRDGAMADVVEREVLARHQRALLVTGKYHALKRVPPDMGDDEVAVQRIERAHPGAVFSVIAVPVPAAGAALHLPPAPSFTVVKGSKAEKALLWTTYPDWAADTPPAKGGGIRIGEAVDGLLNLGGNHGVYPPPAIYLDPAYQKELRRRAAIIKAHSGQDFGSVIDGLVKQAQAGSAAPNQP